MKFIRYSSNLLYILIEKDLIYNLKIRVIKYLLIDIKNYINLYRY